MTQRDSAIFVDRVLARRLELAEACRGAICAEALARLRPESRAAGEPVAGGYAIFAGVDSPLTQVMGVGLDGTISEAEVQTALL